MDKALVLEAGNNAEQIRVSSFSCDKHESSDLVAKQKAKHAKS